MPLAQTNNLQPAVFLDRDGTIIEDCGHRGSPDQVVFLPGSVAALRRLQPHFKLCIVTNRSGVSKGALTMAQVEAVNTHLVDRLRQDGVVITAVYVCPHQRSECCPCIKPSRVPANQITGLLPGEMFVPRNVANVVPPADLNCLSALQFTVDVLKVRHVIVCGHYGCGGVRGDRHGLVDNWLQSVQDFRLQCIKKLRFPFLRSGV